MSARWRVTKAIGVTEVRRRWRAIKANTTQLISLLFAALFFSPVMLAVVAGAFFAGNELQSVDQSVLHTWSRQVSVTLWLLAFGFGGIRGYSTIATPDKRDGLLTTVSHRQLFAGMLFAEAAVFGSIVAVVAVLAGVLFGLGAGSVAAVPAMTVAIGLLVSTGFLAGLTAALLIKNGGVRSRLASRLRTVGFAVLFVLYMSVFITASVDAVLDPLFWLLGPTPIGWLGEFVLWSTGTGGSTLTGLGALIGASGLLAVCVPACSRLSAWLWYADGVSVTHRQSQATDSRWLVRAVGQPMAGVAIRDWIRARRSPVSVSYVLYPLFVLLTPAIRTIETGTVGSSVPILVAACGIWVAGALFSLNIIGNEGVLLPSTLLAPDPGRAIVGGHIAAGALVTLPVTAIAVVVLGVLSPLAAGSVLTLAVGTVGVGIGAAGIASGIGAAFPRHEAVSVSRSKKAIIPSTLSFVLYTVAVGIGMLPLLISHVPFVAGFGASTLGVPAVGISAAGALVASVLTGVVAAVSTLYAIQRVERYQIE